MNRNTLLLLGAFGLGCAAGLFSNSQAHAASAPKQKWLQECESYSSLQALNNGAKRSGENHWEMVGIAANQQQFYACFKRPAG